MTKTINTIISILSSNKSRVQLTHMSSGLIILLFLHLTRFILGMVDLVTTSIMPHVSIETSLLSSIPVLIIPSYLTVHKDLHIWKNVDKLRFKYNGTAIVYAIVCDVTQFIYVGSIWDLRPETWDLRPDTTIQQTSIDKGSSQSSATFRYKWI